MTTAGAGTTFNRRRVRLLVVAVALALVGALVAWTRDEGVLHDKSAGPLHSDSRSQTSIPGAIDEPVTFGGAVVHNKTGKTAVLDAVRVRPPLPAGAEIAEIAVVGPNRTTHGVSSDVVYPSPTLVGHLRPLKGAKVPPESTKAGKAGVEIVFGFKITKPGVFGFREFDLDYRIGSTRHTIRIEDGFIACAPLDAFPDGCDHAHFDTLEAQLD